MLHGYLNALAGEEALEVLGRCCGARRWAEGMLAHRPFSGDRHVLETADAVWAKLGREDYLEAFSHHPKIGSDLASLRKKFQSTADWSSGEQAAVSQADEETLQGLAQGNIDYEAKFGYIFIVCATGKSAGEMLSLLQARLPNPPGPELAIAAGEQAKITRIRLEKLKP
jgi:2-oxo-4-hydroxy-4-carboxy-5-ureidoimidazoline decarboxylase